MRLKELGRFGEHKEIVDFIKENYSYELNCNCPGGEYVCALTGWSCPAEGLTFEMSNKNKEINLCDIMIAEEKYCKDIEDRFEVLIERNILKITKIDKSHRKYTLPSYNDFRRFRKLFFFGQTNYGRSPVIIYYNFERIR